MLTIVDVVVLPERQPHRSAPLAACPLLHQSRSTHAATPVVKLYTVVLVPSIVVRTVPIVSTCSQSSPAQSALRPSVAPTSPSAPPTRPLTWFGFSRTNVVNCVTGTPVTVVRTLIPAPAAQASRIRARLGSEVAALAGVGGGEWGVGRVEWGVSVEAG